MIPDDRLHRSVCLLLQKTLAEFEEGLSMESFKDAHPLTSDCSPRVFRLKVKRVKQDRLYSVHVRTAVEPVTVKSYRKTYTNRDLC